MKQGLRAVAMIAALTLMSGCWGGLAEEDDFNEIASTPQGRAAMVEFITPGVTTYDALMAQFGHPTGTQQVSGSGNPLRAIYSYYWKPGSVLVYYDGDTRIISQVAAYRYNSDTEERELEAAKP